MITLEYGELKANKWQTKDIAKMFGISTTNALNIAYRKGIKLTMIKTPKGVQAQWDYNAYCQIKAYREWYLNHKKELAEKKKAEEIKETCCQQSLEELRKAHPLVTDDRFFKPTYWPDTIPINFLWEEE